jgi:hypothetical protein
VEFLFFFREYATAYHTFIEGRKIITREAYNKPQASGLQEHTHDYSYYSLAIVKNSSPLPMSSSKHSVLYQDLRGHSPSIRLPLHIVEEVGVSVFPNRITNRANQAIKPHPVLVSESLTLPHPPVLEGTVKRRDRKLNSELLLTVMPNLSGANTLHEDVLGRFLLLKAKVAG